MIGRTLSHYEITGKLGAGGMGEVYRAQDSTLKRQVALKVLPPKLAGSQLRLQRFQREAELLAALNHPNIVTIYSVEEAEGVRFLTMELVQGHRLSDCIPAAGMPLGELYRIAIPLADALAAAHEKGVVHRDLKPSNVMLDEEGRVKVLDFGLAKLRPAVASPPTTKDSFDSRGSTDMLTGKNEVVGTMPYMSPEQVDGQELDARSDIFSLGVVLYELATGIRPFKGDTPASLISSIMKDKPIDVDLLREDLPHHLGRVIRMCLDKEVERRYQSAKDVRNELAELRRETESTQSHPVPVPSRDPERSKWREIFMLAAAAALLLVVAGAYFLWQTPPEEPSVPEIVTAPDDRQMIVVLPFDNLGRPEDEYFADGMTDEISSRLASVEGLGVISRTSAMQYKQDRPPISQIASDLGVDYVLEGSVQWLHDPEGWGRVRIIPQLTSAESDIQLWSDRYDRVMDHVFDVQSNIAEQVMDQLQLVLIGEGSSRELWPRPTRDLEAYDAYLRAMEHRRVPDYAEGSLRLAAQLLERAVDLDSDFALAWAELAWVQSALYFNADPSPNRSRKATVAVERALELDPENPTVRAASGSYHYRVHRDFERALDEFETSLRIQPGNAQVLASIAYVKRRQGLWKEALEKFEEAIRLDPRDGLLAISAAETFYALRLYDAASPHFDRAVSLAPDEGTFWGRRSLNELERHGDLDRARNVLNEAPVSEDLSLWRFLQLLDLYAGSFERAVIDVSPLGLDGMLFERADLRLANSLALERLGDRERAVAELEFCRQEMEQALETLPDDPYLQIRLAEAYAGLGKEDEALEWANRAYLARSTDRFSGPGFGERVARTQARLGNVEAAAELLDELLTIPYHNALGVIGLSLDPVWDSIREDARFQRILERHSVNPSASLLGRDFPTLGPQEWAET